MKRAMVAYATWTGGTRGVAEKIGSVLKKASFDVTVSEANAVKNIDDFELVLIGTSIHASRTVRSFRKFLRRFQKELTTKNTAFFVVCANMIEDTDENRAETMEWLKSATNKYPEIQPISVGLFGGAVLTDSDEYQKSIFFVRKIVDAMQEKMVEEYGKSDFRDWGKIQDWIGSVINHLD